MASGTVKWFNNAKGFGFILPEDGQCDLFAHYSSIEMDGYRTLKAGQLVDFDIEEGDKGLHASHIRAHSGETAEPKALKESNPGEDVTSIGTANREAASRIEEAKESALEEAL